MSLDDNKFIEIRKTTITSSKRDGFNDKQSFTDTHKASPLSGKTSPTKLAGKSPIRDPVTKDDSSIGDPRLETNTKITQVKEFTHLFGDDTIDDELIQSSISTQIKEGTTTKQSDITWAAEDNRSKKDTTKLFSDSDDEIFSNTNWVKSKNENAKIFRDGTDSPGSPQSNDENNESSKQVSKLITESSNQIFSTSKTSQEDTGDSNINQPVLSNTGKNKENVTFISKTEFVPNSDKVTSEVMEETNVPKFTAEKKKAYKLLNESDDEMFSNVSKNLIKKESSRLFGSDDESDGELFKNSGSRVAEQKTLRPKTVLRKPQEYLKKSIFNDDSSSDDDLFSSTNKRTGKISNVFYLVAYDCLL